MPDTIQIAITAEADGLSSALDEARGGLEGFAGRVGEVAEALSGLGEAFEAIEAVGQLAALALGTDNAAKLDTAVTDLASTIGAAFKPAIDVVVKGLAELVGGFNDSLKSGGELNPMIEKIVIAVDLAVTAIETFINALRLLWTLGETVLRNLSQAWSTTGAVTGDVMHLDFAKAVADMAAGWSKMAEVTLSGFQHIKDIGQREAEDIKALFANIGIGVVDTSGASGGAASGTGKPQSASTSAGSGESNDMAGWQEALQRQLVEHNVAYNQMKEYELQFWRDVVAQAQQGSSEWWSAQEKVYRLAGEEERQEVEKARQAAKDKAEAAREEADTELSISKMRLEEEKSSLDDEVSATGTAGEQKIAKLRQIADEEEALDLKRLQDELDTLNEGTAAFQRVLDQELIVQEKHNQEMSALDRQAQHQQQSGWNNAFNTINRSFDQMLSGVLQGTQTWQGAMQRMGSNMAVSFIENIVKMGLQWAEHQAEKLLLTQTTDTLIVAADTAQAAGSAAAQNSANLSPSIMKHAGSAAAAVYDDVAQIPYVGWLLAPPAAAAAFAAVMAFGGSFDEGAWSLPSDMLAIVHAGEMIVPADIAAQIRGGNTSVGSFAGGASFGTAAGGTPLQVSFNVTAMDSQSVANWLKQSGPTIANVVAQQIRNANASLTSALQPGS